MKKEYLVSAKEMKQLDANTIEKTGIPSLVLMERASLAVAGCVMDYLGSNRTDRILVVAGTGNNGADGICAGRILTEYGYPVDICLLQGSHGCTEELLLQKKIAESYGISFLREEEIDFSHYKVIVDAIFGVGLNRDVTGPAKEMIDRLNQAGSYVVSVDIPSGINASTGEVCNVAVKADETVTFGFYKCGQTFYPGRIYCGKVTKACIGINETSFYGNEPSVFTYIGGTEEKIDFGRNDAGNKGTFGKVLVVAGRSSTAGAALLCATSALRSGCGMVAVLTEESNKETFLAGLPEAMVETFAADDAGDVLLDKLDKWLNWADVCVIGCGLSKDEIAYELLSHTLTSFDKTIVADADAIHLLARYDELKDITVARGKNTGKESVIVTPHPGELAALAHCGIPEVKADRMGVVQKVCKEYGVITVAKDADTLCMAKGEHTYLNSSGNDGMSTAGSGDVLAGLIGSFAARSVRLGKDIYEAVCLAVYVHGLAGDYQAEQNGKSFMVASDIIEAYKYILK